MAREHAQAPAWSSPLLRVLQSSPLPRQLDCQAYWRLLHLWQAEAVLPLLAAALPNMARP